jgi:glutamate--cysteine ligase
MRQSGEGFFHYAMRKSFEYQGYFDGLVLADERMRMFTAAARESLDKQHEIEAADDLSFDEYLRRYFAQT